MAPDEKVRMLKDLLTDIITHADVWREALETAKKASSEPDADDSYFEHEKGVVERLRTQAKDLLRDDL